MTFLYLFPVNGKIEMNFAVIEHSLGLLAERIRELPILIRFFSKMIIV